MPFSQPILRLISDSSGSARTDFLQCPAADWAERNMRLRYGACGPEEGEPATSFVSKCWAHLLEEHRTLRTWFTDDGKLSTLLQTKFNPFRSTGPLGDGVGWDFDGNGDPLSGMVSFKTMLLSAWRLADAVARKRRNASDMQFATALRLVRTGYTTRAGIHTWRDTALAQRWIAYQTLTFLLAFDADPSWAWDAAKMKTWFGPTDDERMELIEKSSLASPPEAVP
jgi:hypothetical protein